MLLKIILIASAAVCWGRESHRGSESADIDPQVVNGTDAADGEFPWMCSIEYFNFHRCGCALVAAQKVVTAASCVADVFPEDIQVGFNSVDRRFLEQVNVTTINVHPSWNLSNIMNNHDIATVHLAAAPGGANTRPIGLNDQPAVPAVGSDVTITGWGRIDADDPFLPNILKKKDVQVITAAACDPDANDNDHLCLNHPTGSACFADGGGPAVAGGTLVGVISWNDDCESNEATGTTRVSSYKAWVDAN